MTPFGARLAAALVAHGPLCAGIDPHESLLVEWGLPVSADGARDFGLRVVEAASGHVGIVKPQVSFFERHGAAGFSALEEVLAAARSAGLLVIADAKRGDIGSTMDAYARAWLTPGSPLEADALTVSPYLGVGALAGSFDLAAAHGKGLFVLAATSNPEGAALQSASTGSRTVAAEVATEVGARNGDARLGSFGLVVGATLDREAFGLTDDVLSGTPILAPGFGFQGARAEDLPSLFGRVAGNVVASESRSILSAGPGGLAVRIAERAALYA